MAIFLILIVFAVFSIALHLATRVSLAIAPTIVVPCCALFTYFAALLNAMTAGILFLHAFAGACAVYILVFRKQWRDSGLTLLIYLCLLAFIGIAVSSASLQGWDEFSFWGLVAKYIYLNNHLPVQTPLLSYYDYPPGAALFAYYILHFGSHYSEGLLYFGQDILMLTPLMVIFTIKTRQKAMLAFLSVLISMLLYDKSFLHSLYTEFLLASFFSSILLGYYLLCENNYRLLIVLPALLFLPLIKQSGLFFATVCWIFFALDTTIALIKHLLSRKKISQYAVSSHHAAVIWQFIFATMIIPILLYFVHFSWLNHYQALVADKTFSTKAITFSNVLNDFSPTASAYASQIRACFVKALFLDGKGINRLHISVFFCLLLLGIAWRRILKNNPQRNAQFRLRCLLVVLVVGFIFYTVGLLLLYIHSYIPYEALRLASFGRYMSVFILAATLITVPLLIETIPVSSLSSRKIQPLLILMTVLVAIVLYGSSPHKMSEKRQNLHAFAQQVSEYIQQHPGNIYLLWQGSSGFEYIVLKYELFPYITSVTFSIGHPYSAEDIWTTPMSANQFAPLLKPYTYLLLAHADSNFWHQFSTLFAHNYQKENGLYITKPSLTLVLSPSELTNE